MATSKLDDILNDNAATLFAMGQDWTKGDGSASQVDVEVDKAKQAVKDLMLELLGDDIELLPNFGPDQLSGDTSFSENVEATNHVVRKLNEQKAELRRKVEQL